MKSVSTVGAEERPTGGARRNENKPLKQALAIAALGP